MTEFEFRLHELGPIVLAGLALWPIDRAADVIRGWRDYVDSAPDELSTACVIATAPPEEFVPDHLKGQAAVVIAAMYVGDPDEGARVMQPLKDLEPEVDLIQPMPYTAFQAILDPSAPSGYRSYWRGEYMSELTDEAIDTFVEHAPALIAAAIPFSQTIIFRIGQGVAAVPDDATAFSHRDANYLFHPISVWQDPADDEQADRSKPRIRRRDAVLRHRWRVPELHTGGGPGPGRLRGREVRAARGAEEQVRPRQRVPTEPEHQADQAGR